MFHTKYKDLNGQYWIESQEIRSDFDCDCKDAIPTRRTLSDGRVVVWLQCQTCGKSPHAVKSSKYDIESLPEFDDNLYDAIRSHHLKRRNEKLSVIRERFEHAAQERNDEESQEWWFNYSKYLRSDKWRTVRQRVLVRDGNVCQACLDRKADQVHHISYKMYDQLGYSLAFELISICYRCHKLIHPHMADAQHTENSQHINPYLEAAMEVPNGRF